MHLRRNNRSIYRKRTSAHFCFDKSHKLFSTCTHVQQAKGATWGGVVSVCVNFHMPEPRKSPNESPCCLQHHHPKEEVTEAGNKDSPCRVVVLHLSLLIHCCIDCVFIWRGSGGELMSEAAILASTSLPLLFLIWQAAEALGGCRVSRLLL